MELFVLHYRTLVAVGFEPTKRFASDLKSLPFDQTRERYQVHRGGFEPPKRIASDLESLPFDQAREHYHNNILCCYTNYK